MDEYIEIAKKGIHIKAKNKGKFNALKKRTGKTTEQLKHSNNPLTRKRAIFASNAKHWKHGKKADIGNTSESPYNVNNPNTVEGKEAIAQTSNIPTIINNSQQPIVSPNSPVGAGVNPDYQSIEQTQLGQPIFPNGSKMGNWLRNQSVSTNDIVAGGVQAINAFLPYQKPRDNNQKMVNSYNPYPNGTGSHATFRKGGKLKGRKAKQGDTVAISDPKEFKRRQQMYDDSVAISNYSNQAADLAENPTMTYDQMHQYRAKNFPIEAIQRVQKGNGKPLQLGPSVEHILSDGNGVVSERQPYPKQKPVFRKRDNINKVEQSGVKPMKTSLTLDNYPEVPIEDLLGPANYQESQGSYLEQQVFVPDDYHKKLGYPNKKNGGTIAKFGKKVKIKASFADGGEVPSLEQQQSYNAYQKALLSHPDYNPNTINHSDVLQRQVASQVGFDYNTLPIYQQDIANRSSQAPHTVYTGQGVSKVDNWNGSKTAHEVYNDYKYIGPNGQVIDKGANPFSQQEQDNFFSTKPNEQTANWQSNDEGIPVASAIPLQKDNRFKSLGKKTQKSNWHTNENADYSIDSTRVAEDGVAIPQGKDGLYTEGNQVKKVGDNPFTGDTVKFKGPSHAEGGIDINYASQPVEVEGEETGFIDRQGAMNIFGNLTVPGSKMKFKKAGELIAKEETKVNKMGDKGTKLINKSDPKNKFQNPSFNTGAVLQDAHMQRMKELADSKEFLAKTQNNILDLAKFTGIDPKDITKDFKGNMKKGSAKFGKRLAAGGMKMYSPSYEDDVDRTNEEFAPIGPKPDKISNYLTTPSYSDDVNRTNDEFGTYDKFVGPQPDDFFTQPVTNTDIPEKAVTSGDKKTPFKRKSFLRDKLGLSDILPEVSELFDQVEPVTGQQIQPQLLADYQVSMQDQIEGNQGDFNALQKTLSHNPSALGALSAQKYNQDNQVRGQEFRTNQGIKSQIANQNVGILNQAKETNAKLDDEKYVRQTQAKEATRSNRFAAMSSISDKVAQQRRANRTIQIEGGMYHYHLDANGNPVYDVGPLTLTPPQIGLTNAQQQTKETIKTHPYDPEKDETDQTTVKAMGGSVGGGHSYSGGMMAYRGVGNSDEYVEKKKKKKKVSHSF